MSEAYSKTVHGLNSLYEDYIIATKELASTKKMLDEAKEVILCFQKKTEVYLSIYDGDKELRKYRDNAANFLAKHEKKEEV